MLLFQILASLFILFAITRIIGRYKEMRVPKSEVFVWLFFWLFIGFAVWWPSSTDVLAKAVGISRGVDLIVAASVAVIFYLLFKLFTHIHQLKKEMTELVRKLAIEKHGEEAKRPRGQEGEE